MAINKHNLTPEQLQQIALAKRAAAKKMHKGKGVAIQTASGSKARSYSGRHNAKQSSPVFWILSIVGILLIVGITCKIILFPSYAQPKLGLSMANRRPAPTTATEVLGSLPSGSGNASENYEHAISAMIANEKRLEKIGEYIYRTNVLNSNDLALCEEIAESVIAGSKKKRMRYIERQLKKFPDNRFPCARFLLTGSSYDGGRDVVTDLANLTTPLDYLYHHHVSKKNYDKALRVRKAQFTLAWHMANEPSRVAVLLTGLDLIIGNCEKLENLYTKMGNAGMASSTANYREKIQRLRSDLREKFNKMWKLENNQGELSSPTGDIFYIIENDDDLAFRAEGLVLLGAVKYFDYGQRGNVKKTESLIKKYLQSENPILRAAAKSAKLAKQDELSNGYIEEGE